MYHFYKMIKKFKYKFSGYRSYSYHPLGKEENVVREVKRIYELGLGFESDPLIFIQRELFIANQMTKESHCHSY